MNNFKLSFLITLVLSCLINDLNMLANTNDQYLTHYWPIIDGKMNDVIGLSDMTQGNLTSFIEDRFGCPNSALALNGGWTQVPPGYYFDSPEFTISVWVYPQQIGSWSRVIDFANGGPSDNVILTLDSGSNLCQPNLQVYYGNQQAINMVISESISKGKWQFLTATYNGTHGKIYIDGSLKLTLAKSLTMKSLKRSYCYVGKSHWLNDGFSHSYIDDLRFYNKSLIESEIKNLINQNDTTNCLKSSTVPVNTIMKSSCPIFPSLSTNQYLTQYWPITNGTMLDVISSNDMTQGNLTSFIEDRFGCPNSALALNGGWTQVPSGIYFDTPEFTVSVWVYPQQVGKAARIFDFANNENGVFTENILLKLDFGGNPSLLPTLTIFNNTSIMGNQAKSSVPLNNSQWQFLAATFNGTNSRVYINGILTADASVVLKMKKINRTRNFFGQANWNTISYSFSYFDDIKFYNKCLTQEELLNIMNQNQIVTSDNMSTNPTYTTISTSNRTSTSTTSTTTSTTSTTPLITSTTTSITTLTTSTTTSTTTPTTSTTPLTTSTTTSTTTSITTLTTSSTTITTTRTTTLTTSTTTSITTLTTSTTTSTTTLTTSTTTPTTITTSSTAPFTITTTASTTRTTTLTSTNTNNVTNSITSISTSTTSILTYSRRNSSVTDATTSSPNIRLLTTTLIELLLTSSKNLSTEFVESFDTTVKTDSILHLTSEKTTIYSSPIRINPLFDIFSNSSPDIRIILDLLTNSTYDLTGCLVNCTNQGQCALDPQLKKYLCKCYEYYSGSSCQTDTRPCSSMPCMNNGTCLNLQNITDEFKCECQTSLFYGKFCENRVNLCENKTCSMNGVCLMGNNKNNVRCECFKDFTGIDCELENTQAKILRDSVKYTSLVVFLACVITFGTLIVCSDVLSYFGIGERSKIKLKRARKTFKNYSR